MSETSQYKIPTTVRLTPRTETAVSVEAKRNGITFSDQIRRITDAWADTQQTLKPVEKIMVLDRARGELRGVR